jgi:hypothetical protein
MKRKSYITLAALLLSVFATGQTQEDTIKRSVTLYNPYKPSLQEATKRALLPAAADTAKVDVAFSYDFTPGTFIPVYNISPIKSAVLSPDPLPELRKGYVSLGFGNYISPFLEISLSNGRSKNGTIGLFTRSYASAGDIELENKDVVYAGFMDNQAILYGRKFYRRSRLDADIDFKQMSRFAYGYDPDVTGYHPDKNDIRSVYYDVTGTARYFTMEPDSNDLNWDATLRYNLFNRSGSGTHNNPGLTMKAGMNMFGFYGAATVDYDLWLYSNSIDSKSRNLFSLAPYITKGTEDWRFRFGLKAYFDIKEDHDPLSGGVTKAYAYFYPDVSFTFRVIPKFLRATVAIDGSLENNEAQNTAYINPWLMPGDTLFTLRNTDNQLRITAGLSGSMNVAATYALDVSYTLFKDLLLFMNDTIGVGNYFVPVYDDGHLLKVHGETAFPVNSQLKFSIIGNYYGYNLSAQEYAWHKPGWEGSVKADYNLRNKIVASATFSLIGQRYARIAAPENTVKFKMHPNLNLGAEYRYTPVLSFWLKCNNISYSRYYEWNYYPARNFMILGGFTYSL